MNRKASESEHRRSSEVSHGRRRTYSLSSGGRQSISPNFSSRQWSINSPFTIENDENLYLHKIDSKDIEELIGYLSDKIKPLNEFYNFTKAYLDDCLIPYLAMHKYKAFRPVNCLNIDIDEIIRNSELNTLSPQSKLILQGVLAYVLIRHWLTDTNYYENKVYRIGSHDSCVYTTISKAQLGLYCKMKLFYNYFNGLYDEDKICDVFIKAINIAQMKKSESGLDKEYELMVNGNFILPIESVLTNNMNRNIISFYTKYLTNTGFTCLQTYVNENYQKHLLFYEICKTQDDMNKYLLRFKYTDKDYVCQDVDVKRYVFSITRLENLKGLLFKSQNNQNENLIKEIKSYLSYATISKMSIIETFRQIENAYVLDAFLKHIKLNERHLPISLDELINHQFETDVDVTKLGETLINGNSKSALMLIQNHVDLDGVVVLKLENLYDLCLKAKHLAKKLLEAKIGECEKTEKEMKSLEPSSPTNVLRKMTQHLTSNLLRKPSLNSPSLSRKSSIITNSPAITERKSFFSSAQIPTSTANVNTSGANMPQLMSHIDRLIDEKIGYENILAKIDGEEQSQDRLVYSDLSIKPSNTVLNQIRRKISVKKP